MLTFDTVDMVNYIAPTAQDDPWHTKSKVPTNLHRVNISPLSPVLAAVARPAKCLSRHQHLPERGTDSIFHYMHQVSCTHACKAAPPTFCFSK